MHPESHVVETIPAKPLEVALFIVQDAEQMLKDDVPKALECRVCPTCKGSGRSYHTFDYLFLWQDVSYKLAATM